MGGIPQEVEHPTTYYDLELDKTGILRKVRRGRGAPFAKNEIGRVPMAYRGSRSADYMVAASDATHRMKQMADFRCDGTADDVEIQAAVDLLLDTGGKVALSSGTFSLTQQIARAIDNVTIQGAGRGTRVNLDGVTPVISAGGQSGWLILDINTDAGGIDIA